MYLKFALFIFIGFSLACPDEDNCIQCDIANSKCISCESSLLDELTSKCKLDQNPIKNCKVYGPNTAAPSCQKCAWGFGVHGAENNECKKCQIDGCAECNFDDTKCRKCFGQKVVNIAGDQCITIEHFEAPNCEVNVNNEQVKTPFCVSCNSKFSIVNGECVKETIPDCAEMDGNKCFACKYGFYVAKDETCVLNGNKKPDPPSKKSYTGLLILLFAIAIGAGAYWFFKIRPQSNNGLYEPALLS